MSYFYVNTVYNGYFINVLNLHIVQLYSLVIFFLHTPSEKQIY